MNKYLRFKVVFSIVLLILLAPVFAKAAQVHRVVPGECLYCIAQNYGVSLQELIEKNS